MVLLLIGQLRLRSLLGLQSMILEVQSVSVQQGRSLKRRLPVDWSWVKQGRSLAQQ
jgi:hypothetical protein